MDDGDVPLEKMAISGPTLASILQRFSSSQGDVDGLLFGHISQPTPTNLLDDYSDSTTQPNSQPTLIANITGYFCSGTLRSFYDSLGRIDITSLRRALGDQSLLGWFVGRRRTPLRPSMREFSVSNSLCSKTLTLNFKFTPSVFLILSTPQSPDRQLIHTHEYRSFQFCNGVFEPKTMDVINIGPAFRGHYGAFSPISPFPLLSCPTRDLSPSKRMVIDDDDRSKESLSSLRKISKDQQGLDKCAEGFEVGRLNKMVASEAPSCTSELEDLYGKMLAKLEGLARLVEKTSAMLLEQIFSDFLHIEYGGPGTLVVEPFTDMMIALKEKKLPGALEAARAALLWAQNYLDRDWQAWISKTKQGQKCDVK